MGRAEAPLAHKGKHAAYIGIDWRMARCAYCPTDDAAQVAEECFSVCVLDDSGCELRCLWVVVYDGGFSILKFADCQCWENIDIWGQ